LQTTITFLILGARNNLGLGISQCSKKNGYVLNTGDHEILKPVNVILMVEKLHNTQLLLVPIPTQNLRQHLKDLGAIESTAACTVHVDVRWVLLDLLGMIQRPNVAEKRLGMLALLGLLHTSRRAHEFLHSYAIYFLNGYME
jgi:hypothetical protein